MIFIYLPKLNNRVLPIVKKKEVDGGQEQRRKQEMEGQRERRRGREGRKLNGRMEHSKVLSLADSANKNTEYIYISNKQQSFSINCYMQYLGSVSVKKILVIYLKFR